MNKQSQKETQWGISYDLEADYVFEGDLDWVNFMVKSVQKHTLFTKKKKGFGKGQSRAKVFYVQNNGFENLDFIRRG